VVLARAACLKRISKRGRVQGLFRTTKLPERSQGRTLQASRQVAVPCLWADQNRVVTPRKNERPIPDTG
jgi:hypothetical protein